MCFFAVQAEVPSSEFNSSQDSEWHSDTSSAMSSYLRQFQVVETIDKSQPDVWEHHEISRNNSCVNKCRVQIFDATYATLPETKVALESQWLDDSFPFGKAYSQVLSSFQGVDGSCNHDKSSWQFGFVCFHQLPGTQKERPMWLWIILVLGIPEENPRSKRIVQ